MNTTRLLWCVLFASVVLTLGIGAAAFAADAPALGRDMGPAVISPDLPLGTPVLNDLDSYGGWLGLTGKATGFFHTEQLGGRWWFITPEGHAYFMLEMGWAKKENSPRLRSWGFNASDAEADMPYAVDVRFFRAAKKEMPIAQLPGAPPWWTFPDVFDPEWPAICEKRAKEVLTPHAQNPLMIGYYMENEVSLQGWYEGIMHAAKDAPCRAAFVEVARAYYADKPADLATDWQAFGVKTVDDIMGVEGQVPAVEGLKTAWEAAVAERAFSVAAAAGKAVAPNHLNLGMRLFNAPLPSPVVLAAMGKYCDVISLNLYSILPDRLLTQVFTVVPAYYALTGRPTMTSEFSFRGADTLHPNTMGAMPTVKTQAERGVGYLSYVAALASIPSHIGVAWYKYPDDGLDAEWGRYAEDCNFGVVDPQDRPYAVLTETMRATNSMIYEIAADPVQSKSCPLFWRTELTRWDRPGDEVLLQRLLHSDKPFVDPLAAALPEPRKYHESYWVQHKSPNLTINDERFVGWCQANALYTAEDGATTLVLLNVQALTTFPRSLWLGSKCSEPDAPIALESNAQFLSRKLDAQGRLQRVTIADGSFLRTNGGNIELRVDKRIPYLDLQFNPDTKELAVTTRGDAKRLGVRDVQGWKTTWNGTPLAESNVSESDGVTVFAPPL